ncbi:hypothetical protein C8J57DRAFT_459987 [Mycena rebaudengoi]|nr:hypothetical protein C8J57DRAFT_459987 [Mycena rebaudengoi]
MQDQLDNGLGLFWLLCTRGLFAASPDLLARVRGQHGAPTERELQESSTSSQSRGLYRQERGRNAWSSLGRLYAYNATCFFRYLRDPILPGGYFFFVCLPRLPRLLREGFLTVESVALANSWFFKASDNSLYISLCDIGQSRVEAQECLSKIQVTYRALTFTYRFSSGAFTRGTYPQVPRWNLPFSLSRRRWVIF